MRGAAELKYNINSTWQNLNHHSDTLKTKSCVEKQNGDRFLTQCGADTKLPTSGVVYLFV